MDEPKEESEVAHRIALDARDWIVRLTSGDVSAEDLSRFKAWQNSSQSHRDAFERERLFWQKLQAIDDVPRGQSKPKLARALARPNLQRRAFIFGGSAAAVAAACPFAIPRLGVWWKADFSTGVGERASFELADGSSALLNTDSALSVDFSRNLRLVELLKGEAEFKVNAGSQSIFRVAALGGNTQSSGNGFSVRIDDEAATVIALGGAVDVIGPASPREILAPGSAKVELAENQQTRYDLGGFPEAAESTDIGIALAWRTGRIIFEGRRFASAVHELSRYIPERVVLASRSFDNVPVSAVFRTDDALTAMRALAATQGLALRRIPDVMVLIS